MKSSLPAPQLIILSLSLLIASAARAGANCEIPLRAAPEDNGSELSPPEFAYDLSRNNGETLAVGPVILSGSSFLVGHLSSTELQPQLNLPVAEDIFFVRYPTELIGPEPDLVAVDREGKPLWSWRITPSERQKWKTNLETLWKATPAETESAAESRPDTVFWMSQAGIRGFAINESSLAGGKGEFRFCLSDKRPELGTVMCSQLYSIQQIEGKPRVLALKEKAEAKILVGEKEMPSSVIMNGLDESKVFKFFARLKSGISYEFASEPRSLTVDHLARKSDEAFHVGGTGLRPFGAEEIDPLDQVPELWRKIGWEPTIGHLAKRWSATVKEKSPFLYFRGKQGGFFRQSIRAQELPREEDRPVVSCDSPASTFSPSVNLRLRSSGGQFAAAKEGEAIAPSETQNESVWTVLTPAAPGMNRATVHLLKDDQKFVFFHEIDRRMPNEAAARMTGMAISEGNFILGEVAYQRWIEGIFNWKNHWLSLRRWGFNARYAESFVSFRTTDLKALEERRSRFTSLSGDFRYRVLPGTWGWDETFGPLIGLQKIQIGSAHTSMYGLGFFWGRSMPRIFDLAFRQLPLMNYPKWVDLDFTYFMGSMNPEETVRPSWNMNFHGKVMWKPRLFGEAGFGVRKYSYIDSRVEESNDFYSFYGTVGLGVNF